MREWNEKITYLQRVALQVAFDMDFLNG